MTESHTVELSGEDLDRLAAQLGEFWVEQLLDNPRSRREAVGRLCRTIDELTALDRGAQLLRYVQGLMRPGVANEIDLAISYQVPDQLQREQVIDIVIAVVSAEVAVGTFSDSQHCRRVDGDGCICGWSGRDMLRHLVGLRRNRDVTDFVAADYLAEEAARYLQTLMRDPNWAASYWAARSRAEDDPALLFEALRQRGATITQRGGEYHVRFAVGQEPEMADGDAFPLAIDKVDWTKPPGRLLQVWADARGLTDEDLAQVCGLPLDVLKGVEAGSSRITIEVARKLEAGTNTFSANVWLMLERNYRAALIARAHQPHH